MMREALRELYGLQGGLRRAVPRLLAARAGRRLRAVAVGLSDAGLGADRPRAALDGRRCCSSRPLITWVLGNLLGGLAGYYRDNRTLRLRRRRGDGLPPDPLLHRRLRAADRLRLPLAGAADQRRLHDEHDARLRARVHRQRAAALASCRRCRWSWSASAAGSSACARWSRTSSPRTTSSMPSSAASTRRPHPALLRDAQRAGAAGHRPRHVARRHLQRRHHHRAGVRLSRASARCCVGAVHAGDYSLVLGVTAVSIVAVSAAVLLIDLLYPLLDPRVQAALSRCCRSSATCSATTASSRSASSCSLSSLVIAALSFVSPYPPHDSYVVPPDMPPSWAYRSAPPRAARTCSGS